MLAASPVGTPGIGSSRVVIGTPCERHLSSSAMSLGDLVTWYSCPPCMSRQGRGSQTYYRWRGPHDTLVKPMQSEQLDYETEMAVVIGRGGHRISRERAYEHVAGYMIGNDVTARDLAFKDMALHPMFSQITRAKGIPTGASTGPWIATKDEIPDPHRLDLRCWVNGELRQDGMSSEMIVDIPGLIEDFSKVLEFSPGDIIFTGTTTGCGAFQKPPKYLFAGDVLRLEITGLGVMQTPIVDEV